MGFGDIQKDGFQIFKEVFSAGEMELLLRKFPHENGPAGRRHALGDQDIRRLAHDRRLLEIARAILGPSAFPFRATFFSKTPAANWLVTWHQDTALPIREKHDVPGWGPWSVKEGVSYAHAPTEALEQVLALRIHLDDCTSVNGPLRVIPKSHMLSVLSDDEVIAIAWKGGAIDCLAPRGSVLAMRPLLIHSSSKAQSGVPRRVLHLEYTASLDVGDGLRLAIV